jgi:hypothetical protein
MKLCDNELLVSLADEVGGDQAWGTAFGAEVFSQINRKLRTAEPSTLVLLDYAGLKRSDVSFQREAIVETLRKHRPTLLFIAVNLSDSDLRENIAMALERRGEVLLAREPGRSPSVLGKRLTPELQATLERLQAVGELTSSRMDDLKLSTASSRLTFLWKAGLCERVEGTAPTGGREHRFLPIL